MDYIFYFLGVIIIIGEIHFNIKESKQTDSFFEQVENKTYNPSDGGLVLRSFYHLFYLVWLLGGIIFTFQGVLFLLYIFPFSYIFTKLRKTGYYSYAVDGILSSLYIGFLIANAFLIQFDPHKFILDFFV